MASEGLDSEALSINLETTRAEVHPDPRYEILRQGVQGYSGLLGQVEALLAELNHPYRNWGFIVRESRRYALKNFPLYTSKPVGPRICHILGTIFLEALQNSRQNAARVQAADNLILFLEHLAGKAGALAAAYGGVLEELFTGMGSLEEEHFFPLASSFYSLKKVGQQLLNAQPPGFDFVSFCRLLHRALEAAYQYWLDQEDPQQWFREQADEGWDSEVEAGIFAPVGHERLRALRQRLAEVAGKGGHQERARGLVELPDFMDIVHYYQQLPELLGSRRPYARLLVLYKIVESRGLECIHEEALRQINYCLGEIIGRESAAALIPFLARTFAVLRRCKVQHSSGALNCVLTIGRTVFKTGDSRLIDHFLDLAISLGFELPQVRGLSPEWQVVANPVHLLNIRTWLELIEVNPRQASRLASALLVNLFLGGVCIRDTDLFQKDVTRLLNSSIGPLYNLIKQLAKIFPVYFNEIGAEGRLREVSTEIDELYCRKDPLIHFLRKFSHVESNNLILDFTRAIATYWGSRDPQPLQQFLPPEVFEQVRANGSCIDEVHDIFRSLLRENRLKKETELLELDLVTLESQLAEKVSAAPREKRRLLLLVEFYQMLVQKYELGVRNVAPWLQWAKRLGLPDPEDLLGALEGEDLYGRLDAILTYLQSLKEIILAEEPSAPVENIYRKRHIAADIPSLYGTYHERKFDALALTFRLENLANTLFEEIIAKINLDFITRATFFRISKYIGLFSRALALEGITSSRLQRQLELFGKALEVRRFSYSQYMDIFRGFSEAIKQIINRYYQRVHQDNLPMIIEQLGPEQVVSRYQKGEKSRSRTEFINKVSEAFLRDLVARTFGLQSLDNLISRIFTTLNRQRQVLDPGCLDLLMSYDPEKALSAIHQPNPLTLDPIHLGNKGYNLTLLAGQGIAVPAGFIVTTEVFRCRRVLEEFEAAYQDFLQRVREQLARLEDASGCRYGCATKPLLLSVRSGAAISMPGMMNTFLNVGINEEIVEGLIRETGEVWFAWDSYRRFLQSWGMAFGMERDEFDAIIQAYKERYRRQLKRQFTSEEIREVARAYRRALEGRGLEVVDEPWEQLRTAIVQVMRSWYSPKAATYREIMGISENWGTAVTIQAMVYGNLDTNSGAGVAFSHNPRKMEERIRLWGDFTLGNQGEDVVAGLVKTLPLSEEQKAMEGREQEISLESHFPDIFGRLQDIVERLIYEHGWGPQEIEFTFQGNQEDGLFILQSRDMQRRVSRRYSVFLSSPQLERDYLASGIGVSGGALSGRAVFNLEEIDRFRQECPEEPLILIRADTVPDDIKEISAADAILSARGGATSHAAIVANRLGKTCVVGCLQLRVLESQSRCLLRDKEIGAGDFLSIDGRSGAIYQGKHRVTTVELWQ